VAGGLARPSALLTMLLMWAALGFALAGAIVTLWANRATGLEVQADYVTGTVRIGLVHPEAAKTILAFIEHETDGNASPPATAALV
jgi:hypothetical protein